MMPIRSRIPVSRQEKARWRYDRIVEGLRRPEGPRYRTQGRLPEFTGCVAQSFRCPTSLRFARLTGELGKASYEHHKLDFFQ